MVVLGVVGVGVVGVGLCCVVGWGCSAAQEQAGVTGARREWAGREVGGRGEREDNAQGPRIGSDAGELSAGDGGGRAGSRKSGEEQGYQGRIEQMLARAAKARGLAVRMPVRLRVLPRDELIQVVRAHVGREVPAEVVRNQGEFFVGLGVVPPDYDYEEGVYGLIGSQLAGFYEPYDKTMYLAGDLSEAVAEATLAHELVHALQDQHFDLGGRLAFKPEGNDAASAVQALAEGDATSAMLDVMADSSGMAATDVPDEAVIGPLEGSMLAPELAAVPVVLKSSLVAPYVDGLGFVHGLRRTGGWAAVDAAWREAPDTTEQVLHADKYGKRETAERVGTPEAPKGGRWAAVYGDVFGEQGLRIGLEAWLSRRAAAGAAAGWGGDRAVLYRRAEAEEEEAEEGGGGGKVEEGEKGGTGAGAEGVVRRGLARGGLARGGGGVFALAWRVRFDPAGGRYGGALAERTAAVVREAFGRETVRARSVWCWKREGSAPIALGVSKRDLVVAVGPYEHVGGTVRPRASCAQSAGWVASILNGRGT